MLNNKPKANIRLSPIGYWLLFIAFFLLFAAQNTANNLIYIVTSCVFSAFIFAIIEAIYIKNALSIQVTYPEVIATGHYAEIICKITNIKNSSQYFLRFQEDSLEEILPGKTGYLRANYLLESPGKYIFKELAIFRPCMLGIFYIKNTLPEFFIYSIENFQCSDSNTGIQMNKTLANAFDRFSRNGEFWSLELYHEGEDASRINWTVSARSPENWTTIKTPDDELPITSDASSENNKFNIKKESNLLYITGNNFTSIIKNAYTKLLTPQIYRFMVFIALLACVGVYSTGYLSDLLPWIFSIAIILGICGKPLPQKFHTSISEACIIPGIYVLMRAFLPSTPPKIALLLEFAIQIMLLQLSAMSNIRNAFACLTLIFMIILGIGATNTGLAFPLILLPFIIMAAMVLSFFRYNIISTSKKTLNKLSINPKGIGSTIILIAVFILLWIPFFYLIPRTTSFGIAADLADGKNKGFSSNTMELNGAGYLENNPTVVMRIKPIDDKDSTPLIKSMKQKLIRGGSFSEYKNGKWLKTRRGFFVRDLRNTDGELVIDRNHKKSDNLYELEVIIEGGESPVLFVPEGTKVINTNKTHIGCERDGTIFFMDHRNSSNRKYTIAMSIDPLTIADSHLQELFPLRFNRDLLPYLSLKGSTNKIQNLSYSFLNSETTVLQYTEAVIKYLKENYEYSLEQPEIPKNVDPVEYFLFENKQGTCQHFATSMVFLLRSIGIPSRVVNGYTAGEWNDIGSFFTIRQNNAHAWVEAYFPKSGWVSFDPTPSDTSEIETNEIMQFFEKITEIYEGFWFTYVYSFDMSTQNYNIKKISSYIEKFLEKLYKSPEFLIMLIVLLTSYLLFRNKLQAFYRFYNSKNKWLPFSYYLWECQNTSSNNKREMYETPSEYHSRLATMGYLSPENIKKLSEAENLINEYAFNPNVNKSEISSKIKKILSTVRI